MGLLALVFFAAVVGVVKPYFGELRRKHFAAIAGAAFVGMMIFVPKPADQAAQNATSDVSGVRKDVEEKDDSGPALSRSKWSYNVQKDEMRGTESRYAELTSENEVDLDFPYGRQSGRLTLRKNPESGLNVMFSVESGQILCNSFSNSRVSVKFDDGPIQSMGCTDSSDGSNNVAFFTNESKMLAGLRTAKRTVVEAEFFQMGRQQFVFESAGLDWK